ncbi:unnamed protein product [Prorocentrum cordatum]|uniref:HEAT repeat domain-containing protein n=1 Tax=Prorocentrum cordatum TaxID=2364126 RepID=A0ABN9UFH6_9DINO|nr:unnamed protein product [Polarella glacialis]
MVRSEAVEALRAPTRAGCVPLQPLAELLACADGRARCAAAVALGAPAPGRSARWGPAERRLSRRPKLGALLDDESAEVRRAAAEALSRLGPQTAALEERVLRLLADADVRVRAAAARAAGSFGEARGGSGVGGGRGGGSPAALPHPCARAAAAAALGRMGAAAHDRSGELVGCLGDRCAKVRVAAIGSLARFGPRGQMYADIARSMQDEDCGTAVAAIEALAGMGQRGAAFADEVADALEDPRDPVRSAAAAALEAFGWEGAPGAAAEGQ